MTVHVLACGTGDPDLLTVRAERLLATAGAVVHDGAVPAGVLALAGPGAVVIATADATGRAGAGAGAETLVALVALARRHDRVVRLTAGDGAALDAGGAEARALRAAGVTVEVEPVVLAAFAAPAARGIPVMARDLAASVTVAAGEPPVIAHGTVVDASSGSVTGPTAHLDLTAPAEEVARG